MIYPSFRRPTRRYGATSYGTLSSFCFLLSGLFSDLLLVRYSLVLAYSFLIISILLGFPDIYTWGMAPKPVTLAYGNLIWQIASLTVQVQKPAPRAPCCTKNDGRRGAVAEIPLSQNPAPHACSNRIAQ